MVGPTVSTLIEFTPGPAWGVVTRVHVVYTWDTPVMGVLSGACLAAEGGLLVHYIEVRYLPQRRLSVAAEASSRGRPGDPGTTGWSGS